TAAVMAHLDLVISVDTAVAHLAGALGVPVWLALSGASDWRWLQERDDSPWYPSVRLFRQMQWGDWAGVFDSMGVALRQRWASSPAAPQQPGCGTVPVEIAPPELLEQIIGLEIRRSGVRDDPALERIRRALGSLSA